MITAFLLLCFIIGIILIGGVFLFSFGWIFLDLAAFIFIIWAISKFIGWVSGRRKKN